MITADGTKTYRSPGVPRTVDVMFALRQQHRDDHSRLDPELGRETQHLSEGPLLLRVDPLLEGLTHAGIHGLGAPILSVRCARRRGRLMGSRPGRAIRVWSNLWNGWRLGRKTPLLIAHRLEEMFELPPTEVRARVGRPRDPRAAGICCTDELDGKPAPIADDAAVNRTATQEASRRSHGYWRPESFLRHFALNCPLFRCP